MSFLPTFEGVKPIADEKVEASHKPKPTGAQGQYEQKRLEIEQAIQANRDWTAVDAHLLRNAGFLVRTALSEDEGHTHSLFSPSKSSTWLKCTASIAFRLALLQQSVLAEGPKEPSEFADEGTRAHEAAFMLLTGKKPVYDNQEMQDVVEHYADFARTLAPAKTKFHVEERLEADGLFGSCDFWAKSGRDLNILDLKYGAGVEVKAWDNTQLKIYGALVAQTHKLWTKVDNIHLYIYQPRASYDPIEEYKPQIFTISSEKLRFWWINTVLKTIERIKEGNVSFAPTQKACRWCECKPWCQPAITRATQVQATEFMSKDLVDKVAIPNEKLREAIEICEFAQGLLSTMKARAAEEILNGKPVEGMKLVKGNRGNRKWTSEAEEILINVPAAWGKKLMSPAQVEKEIGRKAFKEQMNDLVDRADGKPVLVVEEDPREPMGSVAQELFGDPANKVESKAAAK